MLFIMKQCLYPFSFYRFLSFNCLPQLLQFFSLGVHQPRLLLELLIIFFHFQYEHFNLLLIFCHVFPPNFYILLIWKSLSLSNSYCNVAFSFSFVVVLILRLFTSKFKFPIFKLIIVMV
jgi:hypothetical protein